MKIRIERQSETFAVTEPLRSAQPPAGIDRRAFMMRSAVVGAASVMAGCSAEATDVAAGDPPCGPRPARGGRAAALARPRRREEVEGPGDDDDRRVLQGRARALELAHDRPDAHHLRLLPALHEAAGRSAREGDRRSRCTSSAASARPARATAPSAPRSPASSARSRRPSSPRSSTASRRSPIRAFP